MGRKRNITVAERETLKLKLQGKSCEDCHWKYMRVSRSGSLWCAFYKDEPEYTPCGSFINLMDSFE
jgi:hypothetical protein